MILCMSSSSHPFSSSVAPAARVVRFEQARRLVEQHAAGVCPGEMERGGLLAGVGRCLADVAARPEVVGEVKAGDWPEPGVCSVGRGQAVAIMTGAPLPAGADAVVMVEHTALAQGSRANAAKDAALGFAPRSHPNAAQNAALGWGTLGSGPDTPRSGRDTLGGKFVDILRRVGVGENFVPRGSEARAGQLLLDRGRRLEATGIAIAASPGKSRVQVFPKPRVAVLSTGDEVVEIDTTPGPAQIRNSNSYSLAAQVQNAGGEAVRLAIAPDEPRRLRALIEKSLIEKSLIEEGLDCDLLLLTGGVSMGKYDLVEQVLGEIGRASCRESV